MSSDNKIQENFKQIFGEFAKWRTAAISFVKTDQHGKFRSHSTRFREILCHKILLKSTDKTKVLLKQNKNS
jgi:hypothetical protein